MLGKVWFSREIKCVRMDGEDWDLCIEVKNCGALQLPERPAVAAYSGQSCGESLQAAGGDGLDGITFEDFAAGRIELHIVVRSPEMKSRWSGGANLIHIPLRKPPAFVAEFLWN